MHIATSLLRLTAALLCTLRMPLVCVGLLLGFLFVGMGLSQTAAWLDNLPMFRQSAACVYAPNGGTVCGQPAPVYDSAD
jgi:hypothetical protein